MQIPASQLHKPDLDVLCHFHDNWEAYRLHTFLREADTENLPKGLMTVLLKENVFLLIILLRSVPVFWINALLKIRLPNLYYHLKTGMFPINYLHP